MPPSHHTLTTGLQAGDTHWPHFTEGKPETASPELRVGTQVCPPQTPEHSAPLTASENVKAHPFSSPEVAAVARPLPSTVSLQNEAGRK